MKLFISIIALAVSSYLLDFQCLSHTPACKTYKEHKAKITKIPPPLMQLK